MFPTATPEIPCHLFALGVVCADVGELPADVEQHVVLSRSPLLHKICGEHPGPEHDAVILKTTYTRKNRQKQEGKYAVFHSTSPDTAAKNTNKLVSNGEKVLESRKD